MKKLLACSDIESLATDYLCKVTLFVTLIFLLFNKFDYTSKWETEMSASHDNYRKIPSKCVLQKNKCQITIIQLPVFISSHRLQQDTGER